mgnify:CR=1 FL=1
MILPILTVPRRPPCRSRRELRPVLAFLAVMAVAWLQPASAGTACLVTDAASLRGCAERHRSGPGIIRLSNDVTCTARECCGNRPAGATVDLGGALDVTLDGAGFRITRNAAPLACSAIRIADARRVRVHDLTIDDRGNEGCAPELAGCANTVSIARSADIDFDGVWVAGARRFAVAVGGTERFRFTRGAISDPHVIGIFVGRSDERPSRGVLIADTVVVGSRANAIALRGIAGDTPEENVIRGNVVVGNHHSGAYLNAALGRLFNGGQMLITDARNLTVTDNVIGDGRCQGCDNPVVWGVELGPQRLEDIRLVRNYLYNSAGQAFFLNRGSNVGSGLHIAENVVLGYEDVLTNASTVLLRDNIVGDATPTLRRRGEADASIYRIRTASGKRLEARSPAEAGGTVEEVFRLARSPQPGASPWPLMRCVSGRDGEDDVTTDRSCGGAGRLHSVLGFSHPEGGAVRALYGCRTPVAGAFVSADAGCEGGVPGKLLGYGQVGAGR